MAGSPFSSVCPNCAQRAPIVLQGLSSRCSACGAARLPLTGPTVSLAGQPSRFGGIAASIAGIFVLVLGLSSSAGLWLLLQSIWPASLVGWAFALPLAAASLLFGLLLLFGGRRLRQQGDARKQQVQLDAVRAMVGHRRGPLSALEVAEALQLPEPEVDALLTQLARERATAVTVDVDEQGHVVYDFDGEARRWRVLEEDLEARAAGEADAAAAEQRFKR